MRLIFSLLAILLTTSVYAAPSKPSDCGSNPAPAGATGGRKQLYDHLSMDRTATDLQYALLLESPSLAL
jgi:hypothetical protein